MSVATPSTLATARAMATQARTCSIGSATAEQRADTVKQLLRAERLCHVVVGSGLERARDVSLECARRQQDHRYPLGPRIGPKLSRHFDPVEPRHHQVENGERRPVLDRELERGLTVAGAEHLVPRGLEAILDERTQVGIVVADED